MTVDLAAFDRAYAEAASLAEIEATDGLLREDLEADYDAWSRFFFPRADHAPLAAHHHELWSWAWGIRDGERQAPFAAIWARGAAKSAIAEMVVAAVGARQRRRFVLYVCGTLERAVGHVEAIRLLLESEDFARHYPHCASPQVGKFGNQRGWRDNRLVTAGGFTVEAVGLEQAIRGVRVGEDRPDMIVLDDVDETTDTPKVTQKKVDKVTRSLLPTGAAHAVTLAVQNLILPNGVFARIAGLAEGADRILANATVSGPIPAIRGARLVQDEDRQWRIEAGEPTWAGQSLEVCEAQIAEWTRTSWLIEAQHQVELRSGGMFKAYEWMEDRHVSGPFDPFDPDVRRVRAWDTAATEPTGRNDPDWTVGVLMALKLGPEPRFRIEDVRRFRHTSGEVKNLVRATAEEDVARHGFDGITIGIEEEPGPHGRDRAYAWVHEILAGFNVRRLAAATAGSKETRAEGLAIGMENGMVEIVNAPWTHTFLGELEGFPLADHDDQVDAAAYAYNMLRGYLIGGQTSTTADALTQVRIG